MTYSEISTHHQQMILHQTRKVPIQVSEWLMTIQGQILDNHVPIIVIVRFVKLRKLKDLVSPYRVLT